MILVEREPQAPIVLGRGGSAIKKLGSAARNQIEDFLGRKVYLELSVQVRGNTLVHPRLRSTSCYCWVLSVRVPCKAKLHCNFVHGALDCSETRVIVGYGDLLTAQLGWGGQQNSPSKASDCQSPGVSDMILWLC